MQEIFHIIILVDCTRTVRYPHTYRNSYMYTSMCLASQNFWPDKKTLTWCNSTCNHFNLILSRIKSYTYIYIAMYIHIYEWISFVAMWKFLLGLLYGRHTEITSQTLFRSVQSKQKRYQCTIREQETPYAWQKLTAYLFVCRCACMCSILGADNNRKFFYEFSYLTLITCEHNFAQ